MAWCTSAFAHSDSAYKRHGSALREGASAFAFALPHPAHGGAGHGATTARTLPGSGRRANDILLYIRVRRREGEHVLHRAASNDVDNFSVDNPLWITAAAGCRLLCGGRGRRCGGSVNAGTEVQTQTGRVRKAMRAMGARRGRLSTPWLRFHSVDRADVYIIIRVRESRCGESALNPPTSRPIPHRRPSLAPAQRHPLSEHFRSPHAAQTHTRRLRDAFLAHLTTHSPPKAFARPRSATHPPEHFCSPTQRRCTPAGCAMHSRRPHNPFPTEGLRPPPRSDTPSFRSASGTKKRHRTVHVRCRMSRSTVVAVGHLGW